MSTMPEMSRRTFGGGFGAVVATFSLGQIPALGQTIEGPPPDSFVKFPHLDGWIRIAANNTITVFTGKAELGQGILTALTQIAAEELDADLDSIKIISADTTQGPDEGYTYGSQSIEQSGAALRTASAQARAVLLGAAAAKLKVDASSLAVESGVVKAPDGAKVTYGELASSDPNLLKRDITRLVRAKRADEYKIVGKSISRIDLPDKIMAKPSYVQDLRLPGMVFGRVVRPPHPGAKLLSFDEPAARQLPGVVAIARDGSFLAVAAAREEQAIAAMRSIKASAQWSDNGGHLPDNETLPDALKKFAQQGPIAACDR
jgi:nicotinate dehydrogenase subunit B